MFRKIIKNKKEKKIDILTNLIERFIKIIEEGNFIEFSYILGNKKEMFIRNFLAGVARGIGIGIGVTVITAILVMILQKMVTLNIPIIGEYIADIVEIVQKSKWDRKGALLMSHLAFWVKFFYNLSEKKYKKVKKWEL